MLIDTHAHLAHPLLLADIESVIDKSKSEGIEKIISIGCSLNETNKNLELVKRFGNIKTTAGLYPRDDNALDESHIPWKQRLSEIEKLVSTNKENIVAIGECGLDFSKPSTNEIERDKNDQIDLFKAQIEMARRINLPVIVHSRDATEDTLKVILTEQKNSPLKFVWHCFNEGYDVASKLIDVGVKLSVNGIFTYNNAQELRNCIKKIPQDVYMLETDAPYLLPQSLRKDGVKVNSPQYVKIIANAIAEELQIDAAIIEENTTNTAVSFFNL